MSDECNRAEQEGREAASDPEQDYDDNPYEREDMVRHRGWLVGFSNAREEPKIRAAVRNALKRD